MKSPLGRTTASVLLSLLCGSAIAEPQPANEPQLSAISAFVAGITRWDGERIARWRVPVCPSVSGATAEQGEFIRSRVLELAAAVHAPASGDRQCEANLIIALTEQPAQLWTSWREQYPRMFARESPQNVKRIVESRRPVVSWQNAVLSSARNAAGTAPIDRRTSPIPEYRLSDSRFRSSVSEDIASAIVVVDTSATGGVTFGQLADYIALVSLARVDPRLDPNGDFAGAPTILQVFGKDAARAPKKLTNWDEAFLKGLYRGNEPLMRKRAEIVRVMREELSR